MPRWFTHHPKTVTHPGINHARRIE